MIHKITDNDIFRFTEGECHYLARAINQITGWTIVSFSQYGWEPEEHVFVRMPDGRALDVEGTRSLRGIAREWRRSAKEIDEFDWSEIMDSWGFYKPTSYTYRRAKQVANFLVNQYS